MSNDTEEQVDKLCYLLSGKREADYKYCQGQFDRLDRKEISMDRVITLLKSKYGKKRVNTAFRSVYK